MRAYRNVCEKIMKDWEANPDGTLNFDMWHSTGDETQNGRIYAPYYSNIVSVSRKKTGRLSQL